MDRIHRTGTKFVDGVQVLLMIRHLSTGTHPRTDTSKSPPTSKCFRFLLQIPDTFHASYLTVPCILCSLIFALLKSFWGNCSTIYISFAATAVHTSSSFLFPRKALKKWQLQRSPVSLRVLLSICIRASFVVERNNKVG